ncbi:unnamed protein product [Trichogramma brassicae]|uniref:Uncharacterized protein n=1 Tax=Trichogramma brassicae TaxID=86971 RepID=A0A6H5HYV4_9HYME|nr:unnamed protein product [Trichogramma brassicae]
MHKREFGDRLRSRQIKSECAGRTSARAKETELQREATAMAINKDTNYYFIHISGRGNFRDRGENHGANETRGTVTMIQSITFCIGCYNIKQKSDCLN